MTPGAAQQVGAGAGALRLWIAILAVTAFLAGLAGGVVLGLQVRPEPVESGPFGDYERLLVERFELSPERERALRVVLEQYQRQVDGLFTRNAEELEPELARLGVRFRSVVRDSVLPPDRREEFDRLGGLSALPN